MSKGIRLTKADQDISDAASDEFYIDTDNPLLKLYKASRGSQHFNGTLNEFYTITIPHNLGYRPMYFLFADRIPGAKRRIVTNIDNSIGNPSIFVNLQRCDTQIIEFTMGFLGGTPLSGDYGYNYFIYYDSLDSGYDNV